ncbi:acyl-CoA dehydratase activase-related protein [Paenibacillus sp. IHB B 3415]|uniref:acyl-CoA dehydratase activase-related protein n=1 Tax=Paenibacillus sp. IHB B 3415 TaxID=867080 RepID=UPI00069B32A7|nr:acyl-CoA dehydratase activase-related protein [Paenibacillus sp. IHB B 3415]
MWSTAPFWRTYFKTLGVDRQNIVFSDQTSEEMWQEGGKYGSIDPCYPSKVAQAHIHNLLFKCHEQKPLDYLLFPCIPHLPTHMTHVMDSASCPIAAGSPSLDDTVQKNKPQWFDPVPRPFAAQDKSAVTLLFGGLTMVHDSLVEAALKGLGYRVKHLECPDNESLRYGKEFGNRGQSNPTFFTVGNLIKFLQHLRDEEGKSKEEIIRSYLFVNSGSCGPCRFGSYATEYRKALSDAGFAGFRVLLFQQMVGLK